MGIAVEALLGEGLEVKHLLGMGLISCGLLLIDGRVFRIARDTIWNRAVKAAAEE